MLKNKSKFILLLMLIITLISTFSFATEVSTSDEEGISLISEDAETDAIADTDTDESSNWIQSDLYVFEDSPTISKIVNGNAFIMGDEVTLTGEIGGDVFVLANKLNIDGAYIYSNLFALANEITVNGVIYDIYAMSNTFTLDTEAFVYRDLHVTADTINLKGLVNKDAYITANTYNIDTASSDTLINGNLNYNASSELSLGENIVGGTITYNKNETEVKTTKEIITDYVTDFSKTIAYVLVIAALCIYFAPKFTSKVTSMNRKKSIISFFIGLSSVILGIIACFILFISTIGLNLAIASLLLYIVVCMSGLSFTSIYIAGKCAKHFKQEGNIKLLGLTIAVSGILWLVIHIPVIGGIIQFISTLFGIGTFLVNTLTFNKTEKCQ